MSSNCDKAREIVSHLDMDGADEAQANAIIDACCGNGEARPCVEYLAELAADAACRAYTDNACPACCSYVAGIVAEVFTDMLYESGLGGVIEDFWELGGAIVDSVFPGDCEFDPAKNAAETKAIQTAQAQAEALRVAWVAVHGKLGLTVPAWSNHGERVPITVYQGNVFEFAPYPTTSKPVLMQTATWSQLLLNRAQTSVTNRNDPGSKRFRDFLAVSDSSWGAMWFDAVEQTNRSLAEYFRVEFRHWRCERADQFGASLSQALNVRLRGFGEAREYFTKRIGAFYVDRHTSPIFTFRPIRPIRPSKPPAAAGVAAGGAVVLACGIVGGTWRFLL